MINSDVKETRIYYGEDQDDVPSLSQYVRGIETILADIPQEIKDKYRFELQSILNELSDCKNEHYYEKLRQRGTPLISTIDERIKYKVELLHIKVSKDAPSAVEQFIKANEATSSILSKIDEKNMEGSASMNTQQDVNLTFLSQKGFDTSTFEGLKKALLWLQNADSDELMYGNPTGDPFDVMVGEMRRPMLISSVEMTIQEGQK